MENPTASLFSLPFPSDSSRRTLALLIRGTPLVAAHALGSAAGCAPSAARCSRAGPVAAQPADGHVLAWELLRPSLTQRAGSAGRPRAARHGLAAAAREDARVLMRARPRGTRGAPIARAAGRALRHARARGIAGVVRLSGPAARFAAQAACHATAWWPPCAPLGARVRAVGRVCSCAGPAARPPRPRAPAAALERACASCCSCVGSAHAAHASNASRRLCASVGPPAGAACDQVAHGSVGGFH